MSVIAGISLVTLKQMSEWDYVREVIIIALPYFWE